jgi:hypothetical protein
MRPTKRSGVQFIMRRCKKGVCASKNASREIRGYERSHSACVTCLASKVSGQKPPLCLCSTNGTTSGSVLWRRNRLPGRRRGRSQILLDPATQGGPAKRVTREGSNKQRINLCPRGTLRQF